MSRSIFILATHQPGAPLRVCVASAQVIQLSLLLTQVFPKVDSGGEWGGRDLSR